MIDKLFWSLQLDDVLVNNKSLGICDWSEETGTPTRSERREPSPVNGGRGRKCMFTPDSGTSHLNFPSWAMPSLEKETADWNHMPCGEGENQKFGNLTFVINGEHYDLPSNHWTDRDVNVDQEQGGVCHLNVHTLDIY